jgi:hypothetical protein
MKARLLCVAGPALLTLIGGLLAGGNIIQTKAEAQVGFPVALNIQSSADFYNPLAPYGSWVDTPSYGRCWRPANIEPGWRPYTVGHWEWTDVGWYWASDEPFAWACYHYGYWVTDPYYGWIWVPGTQWAPAWVAWREAPDYIGWAPCGYGALAPADSYFVFVDVHHFHDHLGPRSVIFNDPRIITRTHLVRNFRREDHDFDGVRRTVFANPGPGIAPIQRASGTRVTARPVREVVRQTPVPENARRTLAQPRDQRQRANTPPSQAVPAPTGREQPRLYREAPPAQVPPTGREEPRLYREVPNPQPVPHPAPVLPERPSTRPQVVPQPTVPREQARPAEPEKGRREVEPRREEPPPRVSPAPAPRPEPAPQRPDRDRENDGR